MQPSFAFISPVVVEEVTIPSWRELFGAYGWPASLAEGRNPLTHESILTALNSDPRTDDLALALEALEALGTPDGRDIITEQLKDRQVAAGVIPQGLGERELVARLLIAQRSNGALAEAITRAQVQLQDGYVRRFNDFIGKRALELQQPERKRSAFEKAIREYSEAQDLGDHVQVKLFNDLEGACRFQIMRSHHTRAPLAVLPGASSRAPLPFRPVHGDFVRYEPDLGRLRITARAASIVDFYRTTFGAVFFSDPTFFGGQVCSLAVLQERGRAALARHAVLGVGRVRMTECLWERSDGERLHIRNYDCFDTIERLQLPFREGDVVQAKFKMELLGKSTRPLTVAVRAPSRIEVTQPRHEQLANDVLTSLGIRDAKGAEPRTDLWALAPWRHHISSWRACFGGRDTDALAKRGVLKKTILAAVPAAGHPGAGNVLHAEPVSTTDFVGISEMPEIPSRALSATDLDGLELDVPEFQRYLRERLELTANAVPWSPDNWFLDLGTLDVCGQVFRLVYALRQPAPNAAQAVRAGLPASAALVLLLPRGLAEPTGLSEVLLDGPLPDRRRVVQDIIGVAGLQDRAQAIQLAPAGARLVVDTRHGKVWLDGVEVLGLRPPGQPFGFVEALASACPSPLDGHELSGRLSPGRGDGDQAARSAKTAANKLIRSALSAQGRPYEDIFRSEKGRFRLTVPPFVV